MVALLYPAIELLAYTLWCYLGLRTFRPPMSDLYRRSLRYGFLLARGLLLWRGYLVDQLASDFSHRGRSCSEHPDVRVGLCTRAVDRMVDHGCVDRAGSISFPSPDVRDFAPGPKLALRWNCHPPVLQTFL